jgi:lysine 2,3-aminomutase
MPRTSENKIQTFSSKKNARGEITSTEIALSSLPIEIAQPDIDWTTYDWGAFKEEWHIKDYTLRELIDVSDANHIPSNEVPFQPRHKKVSIKTGGLPEQINSYLRKLILLTGGPNGPIGIQFVADPKRENPEVPNPDYIGSDDSLIEDDHVEVNGVVNKYKNRVLVITTGKCVAYCRFCTRGRLVGKPEEKAKSKEEIDAAFEYIKQDTEIQELIFSGGDPFTLPPEIFEHVITRIIELQKSGQIRSVRFGTRAPIHGGEVAEHVIEQLKRLKRPPHVMLHVNHPKEITTKVVECINKLLGAKARLFSQTVILAGVNDDAEVMEELFNKLDEYGVTPYYAFTGDPTAWGEKYKVPMSKIQSNFKRFRARMSGVAGMVRVVIDVPGGHGKITSEEGFWIDEKTFSDFEGKIFRFDEHDNVVAVPDETNIESVSPKSANENVIFQSAAHFD